MWDFLTHPLAPSADINGGWPARIPDSRRPNESWRGSDTILELRVGHNSTLQNQLV
ncbi:hypothetical protein A2U01_0066323, partial [Trifolium medium]|nr:hypothetical protein [Trifolium medium]